MNSILYEAPAEPATAGAPRAAERGAESAQGRRLAQVFRRSLGRGEVHPLLHVLKCYHGFGDGLASLQTRPPAPAGVAPRAAVCADSLRRRVALLPSLPQAVRQAMAALNEEGASVSAVAECIERDQALTARTLRAANTAFYGAPGRVATIRTAIGVLGLRTVAALVNTAAVSAQFSDGGRCPEFHFREFWRHALTTALIARGMAQRTGLDGEVAFTAGLLHDIGSLVLATQFPEETSTALRFAREHDLPVLQVERAVLGVDHCVAGDVLARHWRFPAAVVQTLAAHHEPAAPADGKPALVDIVTVADALAHGIQPEGGPDDVVPSVAVATWTRVGLGTPACVEILHAAAAGAEALCEALAL